MDFQFETNLCITFGYYLFLEICFIFHVVMPWFGDKYNVIMYAKRQVKWIYVKEICLGIMPALFLGHASYPCPFFVSFNALLWNLIRLYNVHRNKALDSTGYTYYYRLYCTNLSILAFNSTVATIYWTSLCPFRLLLIIFYWYMDQAS